jgi:O-antigen ligase
MPNAKTNIAAAGVLCFLLFVPWVAIAVDRLDAHDLSRVAQLLLALGCVIQLASQPADRVWRLSRFKIAMAAAFCGLAIATVIAAPNIDAAGRELALLIGMVGVALVVAKYARSAQGTAVITMTIVVASALYAGLVLMLCVLALVDRETLERYDIFVGYVNVRFFNHVQTAMLPLLAIASSRVLGRERLAGLAMCALAMNFSLLMFSLSRATSLGLALGGAVSLLLFGRAALPLVCRLALGALLGAMLYAIVFVVLPWLTGTQFSVFAAEGVAGLTTDHSRGMLWRLTERQITQSPWLGIGPMHYAHELNPKAAHPHNIYLQVAAEWGLPMLVLLLGLAGRALVRFTRSILATVDYQQAVVGIGLFTAAVAVAVDGAFSGNFVMPVSQVWLAVLFGWVAAWMQANTVPGSAAAVRAAPRWLSMGMALLLCFSQAWLCWSSLHDLRYQNGQVRLNSASTAIEGRLAPRFWSFGWF